MKRIFFIIFCLWLLPSPAVGAEEILTWEDCLKEAAKNQPDLIAAKEAVIQSRQDQKIAKSGALPTFSGNLNVSAVGSSGESSSNSSYGLSGSQLLFDGMKTSNSIASAKESVRAADYSYQFTSANARLQLRQAFVNLLKAQELITLTEQILSLRKSNLELITLRYESGTEHKGALLTAKANLSEAQYELNSAKRGLETARRVLNQALGRKEFLSLSVKGDLNAVKTEEIRPDFEKLTRQNPSVLKIIAQKNAAAFDVKSSRGEFWPSVSINGDIGKTGHQWPPSGHENSAGLSVTWPFFNGGANTAQLAKSQSVYRQLDEELLSSRNNVLVNLETAWNALSDAAEKVNVQKGFLAAVEEREKIAQAQYTIGLMTFDNWTIIEDDLVSTRKTFLEVRANAMLAEANWVNAKGETLEHEN